MGISEKELWFIFEKGKELARKFRSEDAENKIPTMVYRLLNALRVGDTNTFMDIVMRNYLHYQLEMLPIFVKALSDKGNLYPLGYSFINGLMEKSTQGGDDNG
jgi:CRISPR-associated protein Cst1